MRTPLAYFRGFQLASGASLGAPVFQQIVLKRYFFKERMSRLLESRFLVSAISGQDAAKWFNRYMAELFPEMAMDTEIFRKKAARQFEEAWRGKVFEITHKGAEIKDILEVSQDIRNLVEHNTSRPRSGRQRRRRK